MIIIFEFLTRKCQPKVPCQSIDLKRIFICIIYIILKRNKIERIKHWIYYRKYLKCRNHPFEILIKYWWMPLSSLLEVRHIFYQRNNSNIFENGNFCIIYENIADVRRYYIALVMYSTYMINRSNYKTLGYL